MKTEEERRAELNALYERIDHSITNHTPNEVQIGQIEAYREAARALARGIVAFVPISREQSLAITHFEEAVMWGVKAIILNPRVEHK